MSNALQLITRAIATGANFFISPNLHGLSMHDQVNPPTWSQPFKPAPPHNGTKNGRWPNRNKCRTHGHLYRNMGTAHGKNGQLYMAGQCKRCGQVHALIPARRAESNLDLQANSKSRDHWLRPHVIGDWYYIDGKPAYRINPVTGEKAA
jgi:hypothetical protein